MKRFCASVDHNNGQGEHNNLHVGHNETDGHYNIQKSPVTLGISSVTGLFSVVHKLDSKSPLRFAQ